MKQKSIKGDSITASMVFKTMERYFVMVFQMIVQIIIARILSPDEYGVVAMMAVFISVATVFIQNGFNMALVQKKDAGPADYATAFTLNLIIGLSLYCILLLFVGVIADFYHQSGIKTYMPVLGLLLVIGSFNSIQVAIANRQMMFKSLFKCNVIASLASGLLGILSAFLGVGVWALIIQQLSSCVISSATLFVLQHWTPRFIVSEESAKAMFSFGWKMLVAGLLNQIYNELNSLVIGRKYTSSDLAFYSKGSQFPRFITSGLDVSISSVIYSALSKEQDNFKGLHELMRKSMAMNSYMVMPSLAILAMVASPLITLLLTEKWLPVVPFMQICCLTCAFHPVASVQMQALAALGRSDMRLKLEFIKKSIGIFLLLFAMNYGAIGIAISAAITSIISLFIGAIACKHIAKYSYIETLSDLFSTTGFSVLAMVGMYAVSQTAENSIIQILVTSIVGIMIYGGLSIIFKPYGYIVIKGKIIGFFKR